MAKTKTPFLSLGSRGTVGGVLTSQKRGGDTILRKTPKPTDPYSLAQAYQRWDYRDYAYLWTLLSNSEKQVYRTRGSRYHITGFSQWMRENLQELTNLVGRWRFDEKGGAVAHDSSRNLNHGTIIGASPTTGLIDGAFHFDGLNDWVRIPHLAAYNSPSIGSIELDVYLLSKATLLVLFSKSNNPQTIRPHELWYDSGSDTFKFAVYDGAWHIVTDPFSPSLYTWYHLTGLWDGTRIWIARDTTKTAGPLLAVMPTTARDISIGTLRYGSSNFTLARIDNPTFYTRFLSDPEIKRHSERRYPV